MDGLVGGDAARQKRLGCSPRIELDGRRDLAGRAQRKGNLPRLGNQRGQTGSKDTADFLFGLLDAQDSSLDDVSGEGEVDGSSLSTGVSPSSWRVKRSGSCGTSQTSPK